MKRLLMVAASATTIWAASIDTDGMDRSVAPGDDFAAYASGGWSARTTIPPDRGSWGVTQELAEKTERQLRELLEGAAAADPGSAARKAGDFYAAFVDEAAIEARGTAPLEPALARIAALKDRHALARLLGEELRADVDPLNNSVFHTDRLFGLWVAPALDAPERYTAYLLQGGLGLPDRDYYLEPAAKMAEIRAGYRAHVAALLGLAGLSDPEARAARIVALELKMARVHASAEDSEKVRKVGKPWKIKELAARAPGLDWAELVQGAGLDGVQEIVPWQPAAIRGLSALVASEPLDSWKDWLAFHVIHRASDVLPHRFGDATQDFFGKALSGTPARPERWKLAVRATSAALPDALGELYVKKYFPPESKAQVEALVKNVIAAFRERIDRLDWMTPATKARAKAKLATLYVGIGYPDHWVDYAGLEVARGDAFGNAERAVAFEYRRSLAKVGRKVDRTEWCMSAQTVNAVNLPLQNALNFPAAELQPPFFDPAATSAENYGDVGATIGHEISHSFDATGAEFDERGKLADWWTRTDRAHFTASGAKIVAQYDAYRPFPDLHVNGKLTIDENIADLAGLAAAHDAWRMALGGAEPPAAHGMTGEQQFFLSYAQSWRTKIREALARQRLLVDGHAPADYRADIVRNLDAWYEAFDVKPGQKLYLSPEKRVRIW